MIGKLPTHHENVERTPYSRRHCNGLRINPSYARHITNGFGTTCSRSQSHTTNVGGNEIYYLIVSFPTTLWGFSLGLGSILSTSLCMASGKMEQLNNNFIFSNVIWINVDIIEASPDVFQHCVGENETSI